MMRLIHQLPDMGWEQASLVAQLALHSTFEADDIETLRLILARCTPQRILEALDQAMDELAAEGRLPAIPRGPDAASFFLLYDGVCRLIEVEQAPARLICEPLPLAA